MISLHYVCEDEESPLESTGHWWPILLIGRMIRTITHHEEEVHANERRCDQQCAEEFHEIVVRVCSNSACGSTNFTTPNPFQFYAHPQTPAIPCSWAIPMSLINLGSRVRSTSAKSHSRSHEDSAEAPRHSSSLITSMHCTEAGSPPL